MRNQALDRTQPGLPLKKGRCGTMTHDYKRNGTTTLFAALSLLDGKVMGQCVPRHRHQEFLKFLRRIDRESPEELTLHLVLDNYGTHKTPEVRRWFSRHPRFVLHFIPTSSSGVNLIGRWVRELTRKAVRRGAFVTWLQQLRRERKLTQQELAKLAAVPQTTLAYWERTGRLAARHIILRLASVLDVSLNKLMRPDRAQRDQPC